MNDDSTLAHGGKRTSALLSVFPARARQTLAQRFLPEPCNERVLARVHTEQFRIISRYAGAMMLVNVWNACIIVSAMGGDARQPYAQLWAAVMCVYASVLITFRWLISPANAGQGEAISAVRKTTVHAFALGMIWSLVPGYFFPDGTHTSQLIMICISAGMMGGGAFAFASIPSAAATFSGLIFLGTLYGLWQSGSSVALSISIMMVAYYVALMRGSWVFSSQIRTQTIENYENELASRTDTLTRLPNRAVFMSEAEAAFERYRRMKEVFAILYLDMDNFKQVNDKYGHRAGDHLLIEFARRLEKSVRTLDTVVRLGGDEFAVVLINAEDPSEIAAIAERIIFNLAAGIQIDSTELDCRASVGIAVMSPDIDNVDVLMDRADVALYKAKSNGRNRYCFFDPRHDESARDRRAMKDSLRRAVADHELHLDFQPTVDVTTNRILGFEALVRWTHPQRGIIGPMDFIPVAEESGLIHTMGQWVVEEAVATLATWPREMRMAINMSSVQFRDPLLALDIIECLRSHGISSRRIDIEITETTVLSQCDVTRANLDLLGAAGFGILIDDFSTGFATLSALQAIKCNGIKIDKSFVAGIGVDRTSSAIVRTALALARELELEVIAEGVETREQIDFLKAAGCKVMQGYYLSHPVDGQTPGKYARENSHAASEALGRQGVAA